MKKMFVLLPRNFIVFGDHERNLHYLVLAVLIAHTMLCYASLLRNQTQN